MKIMLVLMFAFSDAHLFPSYFRLGNNIYIDSIFKSWFKRLQLQFNFETAEPSVACRSLMINGLFWFS